MLGTTLLLASWWLVIGITGWSARVAETNVGAGLMRLQALERSHGPASALLGSSIIAKLDAGVVFKGHTGHALNLGIDGGVASYSAERLLGSEAQPRLVLIEANLLTSNRSGNLALLDDASQGLLFRLAAVIPVLRREYRPSTWLYSLLKAAKDARTADGSTASPLDDVSVPAKVPTLQPESASRPEEALIVDRWRPVLDRLRAEGSDVMFVMMPDGENDQRLSRRVARRLAAEHGLPFIDLERDIPESMLQYSDGTHLLGPSALAVSRLLNRVLSGTVEEHDVDSAPVPQ